MERCRPAGERGRAGRDLEFTLHQRELQAVKCEERIAVLRETMEGRQRQAEEAIRHAGVLSDETSALTRVAEGSRKAAEELEGRKLREVRSLVRQTMEGIQHECR